MTLVIKKIDEKKLREFKAEAIRRGLTLSEAIEQAIDLWLNKVNDKDEEERRMNNEAFQKMKDEILSKYHDKYVVIAKGQLIGVFDNAQEVAEELRKLNVRQAIVFNPSKDSNKREGEWLGGSLSSALARKANNRAGTI
uniref:DUF5678 domain-containing protein n=1 Tax=Candidatus Aramenus sulfurataquae TaxID=1326980 RepID=A0AAE3FL04_9CREN|nr:DUF5678 domain-containing protein [Candidatus Aramenus sulfurataquae]